MVMVLGLAAGLVIGAPLPGLAALGMALWQPIWTLVAILAWAFLTLRRSDSGSDDHEAVFLQAVAGELRAGSSLRHALNSASGRAGGLRLERAVRLAAAGQPLERVAEALGRALPSLGALTASAVRTAGVTGGKAADVFDGLALLATEEVGLARERRAATAQTRFSAWIVGGIPVAYLSYAGLSGKLAVLQTAGSVGVVLVTVGSLLLVGGIGAMWGLLRRAER
ncbi:MAG: type II secretion system F family protein [Acidimicrobiia bacterium]|nr:type II secretion system F family protein [Acidimicrobiia bacterium]MDH3398511.1 type II secretion system F family protein [Acidimicrobiia bacterium]